MNVVSDMARGMDHLHQRNVMHGDVKPGNVLIALVPNTSLQDGTVEARKELSVVLKPGHKRDVVCAKLSDFGLSKKALPGHTSVLHTGKGGGSWAVNFLLHAFGYTVDDIPSPSFPCQLLAPVSGWLQRFCGPFRGRAKSQIQVYL